jgi:hypothetical protein
LQGNAKTSKGCSENSSCRVRNPAYCEVSPQRLATLTSKQTLPLKSEKLTCLPWISCIFILWKFVIAITPWFIGGTEFNLAGSLRKRGLALKPRTG